jgi:endo-1,4-beta-xylanase
MQICGCILLFMALSLSGSAQTLRQASEHSGILIGAAVNARYLAETAYTATLAREFNMVEPEDAMKWSVLRPDRYSFDFRDADNIVAFAELHGMKVRGHNLVWHNHNPDWLKHGNFTPDQLSTLLHQHIAQVLGHFRGKVFAWDVVNEAFDENGQLRHSIWYDQPGIGLANRGTQYIEQAFRWAHAVDPQALLFYNDADAEAVNPHSDAIYAMVEDFKQRGVPINGVGFEMHVHDLNPDGASIAANFARFSKLGVQIQITEMDVALAVDSKGNVIEAADLEKQARIYRQIAMICLRTPGCTALQTWGFTDKYSWIPWFTQHKKGDALLFDRNYRAKPAYEALKQALLGTHVDQSSLGIH